MTVQVRVDESDPTPAYEQLRRQLVALMRTGALLEGQRLPSVRQLAADLGLATGTVARTYRELEHAGLVQTRRGAGTRVARADAATLGETGLRRRVEEAVDEVVRQLRLMGADDDSIRRALTEALDRPGWPASPLPSSVEHRAGAPATAG